MRLILVLIALLVVGLLVKHQLTDQPAPVTEIPAIDAPQPPAVPTRPQDVPGFDKDMNQFMDDAEARQKQQIEQAQQ